MVVTTAAGAEYIPEESRVQPSSMSFVTSESDEFVGVELGGRI